jgi:hypothetical protein
MRLDGLDFSFTIQFSVTRNNEAVSMPASLAHGGCGAFFTELENKHMDKVFHKLGLIDYLTIQSPLDKNEFIKRLKDILDMPFHIHERKGKKLYEGEVSQNEFSLRRKKGFLGFDNDSETQVKVHGTINKHDGLLTIHATIIGQTREFLMTWTMVGVLIVVISVIYNSEKFKWEIMLLLTGVFVFYILHRYSTLRNGVSKMRRTVDLELNSLLR